MNYQTTYKYSRELEETLHPKISLIKKISKRSIICILWISLHYTDPQSVMDIKRLKLLRWHAINEIYSSKFGECWTYENQLQWVYRENSNTLKIKNCKNGEIYLTGVLD